MTAPEEKDDAEASGDVRERSGHGRQGLERRGDEGDEGEEDGEVDHAHSCDLLGQIICRPMRVKTEDQKPIDVMASVRLLFLILLERFLVFMPLPPDAPGDRGDHSP